MNQLFHVFQNAPDTVQIFFFVIILFISWNIESIAGLSMGYKKWKHAFLNLKFVFSNIPFQFLVGVVFTYMIHWTSDNKFGFIYLFHINKNHLEVFIVTFVLLDLGEYIYHLLMHKFRIFWRFHIVHHSDCFVDVSTSVREHPGENLVRNCFTLLWIVLLGVPFWALLIRLIIQTASNVFAHLNIRIPENIDKVIGCVLITPNLHQVHHHFERPYTDCNYGDVLSIWDILCGTFCRMPYSDIVFGVDTLMDIDKNTNYLSLVKLPFGQYEILKRIKRTGYNNKS